MLFIFLVLAPRSHFFTAYLLVAELLATRPYPIGLVLNTINYSAPSTAMDKTFCHWARNFSWTKDMDTKIASMYMLSMPLVDCARAATGLLLSAKEAQFLITTRFNTLKWEGKLPKNWQKLYHGGAEKTTTEGYTLEEDLEIIQWSANSKSSIDAKVFVKGDRCAGGICRRADWLNNLPGLDETARQVEREVMEVQIEADGHRWGRPKICGRCDREKAAGFFQKIEREAEK